MTRANRSVFALAFACWNWKCALLSATGRSIVYMTAMARTGLRSGLAIVLVEMAYVTLTAGLYAGMQQQALQFRSRLLGNATIVLGVPSLAQAFDWLTHLAAGAPAPGKAIATVSVFAFVSALFHLHVMRRGAFLTGPIGQSLFDDLQRMPRLAAEFVSAPVVLLLNPARRPERVEPEAAL
jgi:hypothetical protein